MTSKWWIQDLRWPNEISWFSWQLAHDPHQSGLFVCLQAFPLPGGNTANPASPRNMA